MHRYLFVLTFLFLFSLRGKAQSAEDSVKAVISKMFEAMKNGDSHTLLDCFTDSAILQTVVSRQDNVSVQTDAVKEFADFVGTQKQGDADERIVFDLVKADGPLAIAWTPYRFYYKQQFSHCGVDSYQLVRINGQWKIQYLIDTRRKTGCNP